MGAACVVAWHVCTPVHTCVHVCVLRHEDVLNPLPPPRGTSSLAAQQRWALAPFSAHFTDGVTEAWSHKPPGTLL